MPFFAVRQKMILQNLDPDILGKVDEPKKDYKRVKKIEKKSPVVERHTIKVPTTAELKQALINIKMNSLKKKKEHKIDGRSLLDGIPYSSA